MNSNNTEYYSLPVTKAELKQVDRIAIVLLLNLMRSSTITKPSAWYSSVLFTVYTQFTSLFWNLGSILLIERGCHGSHTQTVLWVTDPLRLPVVFLKYLTTDRVVSVRSGEYGYGCGFGVREQNSVLWQRRACNWLCALCRKFHERKSVVKLVGLWSSI